MKHGGETRTETGVCDNEPIIHHYGFWIYERGLWHKFVKEASGMRSLQSGESLVDNISTILNLILMELSGSLLRVFSHISASSFTSLIITINLANKDLSASHRDVDSDTELGRFKRWLLPNDEIKQDENLEFWSLMKCFDWNNGTRVQSLPEICEWIESLSVDMLMLMLARFAGCVFAGCSATDTAALPLYTEQPAGFPRFVLKN